MNTPSIDANKLISAVKPRPPLYSRNERFEVGHRNTKAKLWKEVCEELNPTYKEMSNTEQREYGMKPTQTNSKNLIFINKS